MLNPLISIVVPAKNAQNTLKKCIDSLFSLDYPNYEIIVVNDGSSDDTAKVLADYPQIKIITTAGVGPSKAKNLAVAQAKGEFVAFTDADCLADKNWLRELSSAFTQENIAAVGGAQKSPPDDSRFGKMVHNFLSTVGFVSDYMQSGKKIRKTNHNPSCNVVYRKAVLLETGGFLENLWPGEDVELDWRIRKKGFCLLFNPAAAVFHYRPQKLKAFLKMMFRYGWAQGFLVKKYGIMRKIQLEPIFLIVLVVIFFNKPLWAILFLLFLCGIIFFRSLNYLTSFFFIIFLLFITLIGWNLGFLWGLFKKNAKANI